MQSDSYSRTITVNTNPDIAFRALTREIDKWWGAVSNEVNAKVDTFTAFFDEDATQWTFLITHFEPNSAVDMQCIDAEHVVEGLPESIREEWLGTTLKWRLQEVESGTRINFTHEGLVAELGCYDTCVAGWDYFFVNSLQNYLNERVKQA